MAAPNFQTTALQLEKVLQNPATFWPTETEVYDLIKPSEVEKVSGRAMRVPVDLLDGGVAALISPDGGSFPRGGAYTPDVATITPVWFGYTKEITAADMAATDDSSKAVENFVTKNVSMALGRFKEFLETQIVGDGSGSLGAVSGLALPACTVANPHLYFDGQLVTVWSAIAGTNRGTALISSVDYVNKTVTFATSIPSRFSGVATAPASIAGFANGDLLLPYGADGTATGSVLGIKYHHNSSLTGTWMGINRATYPGKLSTPYVNGNSGTISQGIVRLMFDKLGRAEGIKGEDLDSVVFLGGPDMRAQWEGVGTLVSSIIFNQVNGDSAIDPMKKNGPATIAQRKFVVSNRATPQRIDGLVLNKWGKGEIQPLGPYSPTGQSSYLTYGSNGAIATSIMYNFWTGFNVFSKKPLAGVYADSFAAQSGY
jgi:hypothetical protein